jgi:hypothetical protein
MWGASFEVQVRETLLFRSLGDWRNRRNDWHDGEARSDFANMTRHQGAKPADLSVMQSIKFELVIKPHDRQGA